MRTPVSRVRVLLPAAFVLALAAGCGSGDDRVGSAREPKDTSGKSPAAAAPAADGEYRILGAMYPADNPAWFFKFTGPSAEIAKFEADFDKLLASVKIGGGNPEFTLPAGWTRGGGRDSGFIKVAETIKPPGSSLEATVMAAGGGVKSNVDRWAGQVGMAGDAMSATKTFDAVGVKGLRVDVRGPKNPAGGMMGGKR